MKSGYKKCTSGEDENRLVSDFDELDAKNNTILREVSSTVKGLDLDIKQNRAENSKENDQSHLIRMKEGQFHSLSENLKNTMTKAQEMNMQFQNMVKAKLKRQIRTVNDGSLTKQEIDDAVNSNNTEVLNQLVH